MTSPIRRIRALVGGYVQGVGYRAFAIDAARRLGIVGYVRNLPDGRVEVVAEGPEDALRDLLAELRKGPYSARVERLDFQWEPPKADMHTFSVRF